MYLVLYLLVLCMYTDVYDERDVSGARNLMIKTILTEDNEDEVEAYLKQKYASAPAAR